MARWPLGFLVLAAILLAACGSADKTPVIEIRVENSRFAPPVVNVPAGQTVKLVLRNMDGGEHDMEIAGVRPAVLSGGGHPGGHQGAGGMDGAVAVHAFAHKSASMTLRIDQPGTYEFYCTVPGHKEAGMVGRMIVS